MKLFNTALAAILLSLPLGSVAQQQRSPEFKQKYQLKEAVVLSRHNIRSPLSDSKSDLGRMTPHQWTVWSAPKSELTLRGGAVETMMGQYFRKWAEDAGLFPENHQPSADDVNVQANSMQRCIATAQYFTSGFMPVGGVEVNHRYVPSKMDPLFNPQLTKVSPEFVAIAMKQIAEQGGKNGIRGISEQLRPDYELIIDVLDVDKSPMTKDNDPKLKALDNYDTEFVFEQFREPGLKSGSALKTLNGASDAFILQYYEEPDTLKAAFGHKLTRADWERLAHIKDVYQDALFTAPIVAVNVARPLIQYMYDELRSPDRRFTFLVGHDSNLSSVATALGVEPYELPAAIEKKTPIGSKIVVEKFEGKDGKTYADINIVYPTLEQLRNLQLITLDNPPMVYPLSLEGLERNADGLYLLSDVESRFEQALRAYDAIP
ncbi:histidine-type phosphatase [Paramuribaculum intestinale]|jgi:glucose-1-phosphatase|uniref:Histidine-type phosphatase n=5 Tax=Paramuribaculum intestinale TaxID=2094151 RepID=A0A2V1J3A8_9BACT|nr:histidine-type phosphatase [Paramuribaculum intestinale]ROS93751.1 histidine-type phosphatase [Muribaculaceae bacterium Isolate-043 (Harlan)]ROT16985.1 histidine-type phosphatase [Muribaculaceae bacterium Isolate-105 (HZI)]MCX4330478.1 histidine-type phosphatase [Paramuribaculum intestinale]PWB09437.1 histidine-type phosphatase [Paramuribaculum intestinale]PWB12675.1 histidine-type phosphatase [Paramuribaculum intestinale]